VTKPIVFPGRAFCERGLSRSFKVPLRTAPLASIEKSLSDQLTNNGDRFSANAFLTIFALMIGFVTRNSKAPIDKAFLLLWG